ncbi:hypothetical protein AB0323_16630 [Arthrobacter sp. NPDC080031]|uniref:hypothetical protein n=1 Tax=Arthrobacter sp. NPDC080031 TaxID=3155918 RepID=UPI00344EFD68
MPTLCIDVDLPMDGEAEWIVGTWFSVSEGPQLHPGPDTWWINGRHRTWGLAQAGFEVAPVLNASFGDLISAWSPDADACFPPDRDDIAGHREVIRWWSTSDEAKAWRLFNPSHATEWSAVLDAWDDRLAKTGR